MAEKETRPTEIPAGIVALTTYGSITPETTASLMETVKYNISVGITNANYVTVPGNLVDKCRNEAVRMMLANPAWRYILFVDADMQFDASVIGNLILCSYMEQPWQDKNGKLWTPTHWADMIGAYCQLRGTPYLPTIDPGSGTWESFDAGMGPIEVIRTGSAFVLIKRHLFERIEYPWYGVRPAPRPIDMMAEFDNYVRCKMDGRNPFRDDELWGRIEQAAREDARSQRLNPQAQGPGGFIGSVGEDSNFADKVKAIGGRIVVNTDIVANHVERRPITPADHIKAMREAEKWTRLAVGIVA